MKTILSFVLVTVLCIISGCSGTNNPSTTENQPENAAMSVDSLLTNAPMLVDSCVTVQGVCTHTCRHSTAKIFINGSGDGKVIRVEAGEIGSFNPEVVNSVVTVNGYLREQRIDESYLARWEEMVESNKLQADGEADGGCDSERAARGVQAQSAADQIKEYRQRISSNVEAGGNPWLSFYYIDAIDYTIE